MELDCLWHIHEPGFKMTAYSISAFSVTHVTLCVVDTYGNSGSHHTIVSSSKVLEEGVVQQTMWSSLMATQHLTRRWESSVGATTSQSLCPAARVTASQSGSFRMGQAQRQASESLWKEVSYVDIRAKYRVIWTFEE